MNSTKTIGIGLLMSALTSVAQTNIFPSSGNVGIGTASPATSLHIANSTPSILLQDMAPGGKVYSLSSRWGGYFTVFDEGNSSQARLSISPAGNLGVGVTVPAFKLDVSNDNFNAIRATGNSTNSIGIFIQNTVSSGHQWAMISSGGTPAPVGSFSIWDDTSGGPRFTISPAGDVGIGTTNPTAKLDFGVSVPNRKKIIGTYSDGNIFTGIGMDATSAGIRLAGDPSNNTNPLIDVGYYSMDGNLTWTSRLFVTSAGNLGVGTTSPDGVLTTYKTGAGQVTFYGTDGLSTGSRAVFAQGSHNGVSIIGSTSNGTSRGDFAIYTADTEQMRFSTNGNVGIGVTNPTTKLAVNGTVRAKEVVVETTGWSDYVFADNYDLRPLSEVEQHIKEHKHLPGIPSAQDVAKDGVGVGEMQAKLLKQIEELTLHVIAQEKRLNEQSARITMLERENDTLRSH